MPMPRPGPIVDRPEPTSFSATMTRVPSMCLLLYRLWASPKDSSMTMSTALHAEGTETGAAGAPRRCDLVVGRGEADVHGAQDGEHVRLKKRDEHLERVHGEQE